MSDRLHVATRKGLFTIDRRRNGGWSVSEAQFLGDSCTMVVRDPRDGAIYAALQHGHFGTKLHRSTDDGGTWVEVAAPVYPEPPDDDEIKP
ncbi:MAG: exo-alpha-sialidase, partial [Planctomycetota bacterium]